MTKPTCTQSFFFSHSSGTVRRQVYVSAQTFNAGRRFPFGSLGNSWSRASSPGQLPVLRVFRWFAWGVWSIASPMSTGRPRGRKTPQLAGVQLLSLPRLWLLAQASQWALLPLPLPLLRRRTPSSLPLIPSLSHPPEQALQTTAAGATKTSNTFCPGAKPLYIYIYIFRIQCHTLYLY